MRSPVYILTIFTLLAMLHQTASADEGIKLKYSVTPVADAKTLSLFAVFASKELTNTFSEQSQTIEILPDLNAEQPAQISVEWTENRIMSFPIFLLPVFSGETIEVSFSLTPIVEMQIGDLLSEHCRRRNPAKPKVAFNSISVCSAIAKWLEDNQQRWSPEYFHAINGWLTANNWLYRLKSKKADFSPYGFDPDLIATLKEVKEWADDKRLENSKISPLQLEEISTALNAHDEEAGRLTAVLKAYNAQVVRMVGVVPNLVKTKQLLVAQKVNDTAIKAYNELSGGNDHVVIDGVNGRLLGENAAYIQSLIDRTSF